MVSSGTTPYFTKLKMERNSVSVLVSKLENPQAPDTPATGVGALQSCMSHLAPLTLSDEAKSTYLLSFLESDESVVTVPKNLLGTTGVDIICPGQAVNKLVSWELPNH